MRRRWALGLTLPTPSWGNLVAQTTISSTKLRVIAIFHGMVISLLFFSQVNATESTSVCCTWRISVWAPLLPTINVSPRSGPYKRIEIRVEWDYYLWRALINCQSFLPWIAAVFCSLAWIIYKCWEISGNLNKGLLQGLLSWKLVFIEIIGKLCDRPRRKIT